MAALLSGHDGDPTLPPGGGTVAVTTILRGGTCRTSPSMSSSEAVVTPPVEQLAAQVSFFTRNGKVYRQTVEELGEVSDSDIVGLPGTPASMCKCRQFRSRWCESAGSDANSHCRASQQCRLPPERFDYGRRVRGGAD